MIRSGLRPSFGTTLASGVFFFLALAASAQPTTATQPEGVTRAPPPPEHSAEHQQQVPEEDFSKLTLAQLMEVEIVPTQLVDTHAHARGEVMISYRLMTMAMKGNRVGTSRVEADEVLRAFAMSPTEMSMYMHMLELMYAPVDSVTFMAMVPYKMLSMKHVARDPQVGMEGHSAEEGGFPERTTGLGDVTVMGLYAARTSPWSQLVLQGGVSFPTGSVDEMLGDRRQEYMMQLGSGSFGLVPALAFVGQAHPWTMEARAQATFRLGMNRHGYRLGNEYSVSALGAYKLSRQVAASIKAEGRWFDGINGADPTLDAAMEPTMNPSLYRGKRVDLGFGLTLHEGAGGSKGRVSLGLEAGLPVLQQLEGPQLEVDWYGAVTVSFAR